MLAPCFAPRSLGSGWEIRELTSEEKMTTGSISIECSRCLSRQGCAYVRLRSHVCSAAGLLFVARCIRGRGTSPPAVSGSAEGER